MKLNLNDIQVFCEKQIAELRPKAVKYKNTVIERVKAFTNSCKKLWNNVSGFFTKRVKTISDKISAMSGRRKVYICLSVFVVVFFLWQLCVKDFTRVSFVLVNLVMVALFAALVSYMLVMTHKTVETLNDQVDVMKSERKKKDKEVAQLKSEILDMKMSSRNKTTFGKNSQALIDAVRKNMREQAKDDLPGQFLLRSMAQCYEICGGIAYMKNDETGQFDYAGEYALVEKPALHSIDENESIVGQVITSGKVATYKDLTSDELVAMSGLGKTQKVILYILPVKKNSQTVAIIEVASFNKLAIAEIWSDIDNQLLTEN